MLKQQTSEKQGFKILMKFIRDTNDENSYEDLRNFLAKDNSFFSARGEDGRSALQVIVDDAIANGVRGHPAKILNCITTKWVNVAAGVGTILDYVNEEKKDLRNRVIRQRCSDIIEILTVNEAKTFEKVKEEGWKVIGYITSDEFGGAPERINDFLGQNNKEINKMFLSTQNDEGQRPLRVLMDSAFASARSIEGTARTVYEQLLKAGADPSDMTDAARDALQKKVGQLNVRELAQTLLQKAEDNLGAPQKGGETLAKKQFKYWQSEKSYCTSMLEILKVNPEVFAENATEHHKKSNEQEVSTQLGDVTHTPVAQNIGEQK